MAVAARCTGLLNWLFRDRSNGRFVVVQFPNVALWVFLAATLLSPLASGTAALVVRWTSVLALLWWSADELLRGVNPFRRILGLIVGVITCAGAVSALWL